MPAFLLKRVLEAIGSHDTTALSWNAGGMIAIAVVTGALGVVQTLMSNQVGQRVMHDLRAAVFRHLQRLSLAFFTRTRTGEVQSRISNDIGGVQNVVTNTATSIAQNVTTVVATIVGMLLLSWELALFAFALIPLFVVLTRRVGAERRKIAKTTQETLADISSLVQESLSVSGILLGKTMGRTVRARRPLRGRLAAARRPRGAPADGRALGDGLDPDELRGHARGGLLVRRARARARLARSSVPMLVSFTTLQTRLFFPVGSLLGVSLDVQTSLALFDRIFEYLDAPVDIAEKPGARRARRGPATSSSTASGSATRPRRRWTLEDVSFAVPAGTTTALVGETGSGQDDARLPRRAALRRRPRRGHDRRRRRARPLLPGARRISSASSRRRRISSTPSVRENLRFAKPDATDAEVEAAAEAARIHHVIAALPDGYDTMVGERGYRFSGGEKQRMAIARTILRNPPILVLDEATSSLDTETERLVQEALDRLSAGRTTIAIAHRLSTVRDADQIVVLDRGRVAEIGRHEELLARGGRYAALVSRDAELGALAAAARRRGRRLRVRS